MTQPRGRAAVVLNPTKIEDPAALRAEVDGALQQAGWAPARWYETTAEDPGLQMTRQARHDGADVVVAAGGDGTVRACAQALAEDAAEGSAEVALAVLPLGTGNLVARNLGIPTDLAKALAVVVDGIDRPLDLGRLRTPGAADRAFTVMFGLGFDAAMLAGASEQAKARLGWAAYAVSGLRRLRGPRFRVTITPDEGPTRTHRARAVLVANLGTLQAGLELLPDARPDDGRLDVAVVSPRGLADWAGLAWHVARGRREDVPGRIERFRVREVTVRPARAEEAELDGDPVGGVRSVTVDVRPGAVRIRVPAA